MYTSPATAFALLSLIFTSYASAFVSLIPVGRQCQHDRGSALELEATSLSRRDLFARTISLVGAAAVVVTTNVQPAEATYSAYAAREKDWEERLKKGEVKVSSSRELRKQLRDLVPENNESRSKVFCPNGTPSNVSPLMENKCSDVLLALPSVYGRTIDSVGNSIPGGFTGGELTSLTAATGGFPKY